MEPKLPRGTCGICGIEVPIRDKRSKGVVYCGRIHANMAKYSTRYRGSNSGPADRPNLADKMKKL